MDQKKTETRVLLSSGLLSAAAIVLSSFFQTMGWDVDVTMLNDNTLTVTEFATFISYVVGAGVLARFGISHKIVKAEKIEKVE